MTPMAEMMVFGSGKGKVRSASPAALAAALVLFGALGDSEPVPAAPPAFQESKGEAGFTGTSACRPCHEEFYGLWAPSHHGLAMQPYTEELAGRELAPHAGEIAIGRSRYRAAVEPGAGWIVERVPEGEKRFPIAHVLGGKNVYYFLTPMERGRLQTLPLAFDVRERRWFDTAASGVRHFPGRPEDDEPVDWRDPVYTFNTACFRCHVSQLATNYDLATDSYNTVWREPGINCETCHGPGEEHVRVFTEASEGQPPADTRIIRGGSGFTAEQNNDACAPCHARMRPLTGSFMPGDRFFDHFDLTTLEHEDFYPDGRDLGENYTFTLWRLNPCARSGSLDCTHCHTSSGRFRQQDDPDQACLPCHAERVAAAPEHTHHAEGSEGSRCIACHMPVTEFARMRRSDHSALPPAPAATIAFESPNACNLCHSGECAAWANEMVRAWHTRDYQGPVLHRAGLIAAARRGDWTSLPDMLDYLSSEDREEIFACALIRLLRLCHDERIGPAFITALKDPSPLVRSAAAEALRAAPSAEAGKALLAATADDYRVVRVAAAGALAAYPAPAVATLAGDEGVARLRAAAAEFLSSLCVRPDHWTSHYNLGNYYMEAEDLDAALASFETALRLEPRAVTALVNASLAHARQGDLARAGDLLERALRVEPDNAAALFNAGLLAAEREDYAAAEARLAAAFASDPALHEAAFNLGVILARDQSRIDQAIEWCRRAYELESVPRYGYTLAFYLTRSGDGDEAGRILEKVIAESPDYADAYLLLGDILESGGEIDAAADLYRRGIACDRMPGRDRLRLKLELESLGG